MFHSIGTDGEEWDQQTTNWKVGKNLMQRETISINKLSKWTRG